MSMEQTKTLKVVKETAPTIKVTGAYLHQSLTWPGVTASEKSIVFPRFKGEYTLMPQGLLLSIKDKNGMPKHTLVPHANICNMIVEVS